MTDKTIQVTLDDEKKWREVEEQSPSLPAAAHDVGMYLVAEEDSRTWHVTAEEEAEAARPGGPRGTLNPGELLCAEYRVERTLFPHETVRAGLYICRGPAERVMVKVYATEYPPRQELWQRLVFLRHPNIIRTYQTLEADGYYYEIQELCTAGTLAQRVPKPGSASPPVTAEWMMKTFIPQMAAALRYLHDEEIIHRDIKPANIYVKEAGGRETLILADFDIASVLEQARTSRDTQRAAGTWLYTAPEAFPRFLDNRASTKGGRVTRASDYYSLGITIIELLLGTTSLHQCQLPDLFDFYLQGCRVEIPSRIPGQLALLLRGLLIRDRRTRWGAPEVARWLSGQTTDADLQRIQEDEAFEMARASRPYQLNARVCIDLPGLAEAMFHEQETASEDLLAGDLLLNWIVSVDPNVARTIRRERDRMPVSPEMVLHTAIFSCDPTRPFVFDDGTEVHTADAWLAHMIELVKNGTLPPATCCTPTLLCQLEAFLRCKERPKLILANGVAAIQHSPENVRLEELAYLFQPDRPYAIMRDMAAQTPKELVTLTYGPLEGWRGKTAPPCYEASYARWKDGALCAWLRQRGLEEIAAQCEEIRARLQENSYAAFETILRLLDSKLPLVAVCLDMSEMAGTRIILRGKQRTYTLRYRTVGAGVPFGALALNETLPGLQLADPIVRERTGEVRVTIDSRQDQPALRIFQASLELESGIARLVNTSTTLSYQIRYPIDYAISRVLACMAVGGLVLGIPRILLSVMGRPRTISGQDATITRLWNRFITGEFPGIDFILGLLILGTCVYVGLRLWFWAYRRSET